ncbi:MAG: Smr/MutS family protein [Sphingomonadales bacterium]|nr:Smr/MutS family protein [Sphingomonadales bacterium]
MRRPTRSLTTEEAALWARVATTITPIKGRRTAAETPSQMPSHATPAPPIPPRKVRGRVPPPPPVTTEPPRHAPRPLDHQTLDASWDRKLTRGVVAPDFTLDLHGHTLDAAHARLDHGLALALAQGARVVLLVTGRARPSDDHADRNARRGAIRAKFMDWLAHGPHASRIAAIRGAHPRHGGAGAVYIVLKKARI